MEFDVLLNEAINDYLVADAAVNEEVLKGNKLFEDEQRGKALRVALAGLLKKSKESGHPMTMLDIKMELRRVWPQGVNDPEVLDSFIEAYKSHGGKMV